MLLTLILLNLPSRTTARLKLDIGSVFLPLFGVAGSLQQMANEAGDLAVPRRELLRQNQTLLHENQELRLQAMRNEDIERENSRLRALLGWESHQPWKLKLAKVVLREPSNWWRSVEIDAGSRDGIKKNMPVLTTQGLVGRIASVSFLRSQVVLLGDSACRVSARVQNKTGETGIIGASSPINSEIVEMSYLSGTTDLKPGQRVVTSGLGGVFPEGIPIGKIIDLQTVDFGVASAARVRLAADLSGLDEVWVVTQ